MNGIVFLKKHKKSTGDLVASVKSCIHQEKYEQALDLLFKYNLLSWHILLWYQIPILKAIQTSSRRHKVLHYILDSLSRVPYHNGNEQEFIVICNTIYQELGSLRDIHFMSTPMIEAHIRLGIIHEAEHWFSLLFDNYSSIYTNKYATVYVLCLIYHCQFNKAVSFIRLHQRSNPPFELKNNLYAMLACLHALQGDYAHAIDLFDNVKWSTNAPSMWHVCLWYSLLQVGYREEALEFANQFFETGREVVVPEHPWHLLHMNSKYSVFFSVSLMTESIKVLYERKFLVLPMALSLARRGLFTNVTLLFDSTSDDLLLYSSSQGGHF
jgi:tetratricopeptide (TPR) repeat protein